MTSDSRTTIATESSEAQAFSEIVAWSSSFPAWQRDALRRLCSKDKLEQTDLDELLAICIGQKNADPITMKHIRDSAVSDVKVSISKLHDLQHVNALQAGETLSFSKTGLTVVYGDNGAGKSGYARVLKQACRARLPKGDVILPNIYAKENGTPQAKISFSANGQKQSVSWSQGCPTDGRLTAISVFDSCTAAVHVDATNDLAYTPLPLRVLAALAESCKEIKNRLDTEISNIEKQTPDILKNPACSPGTEVGKFLSSLSAKNTNTNIKRLSGLSESEVKKMDSLATDLASDPERVARQLQVHIAQLDNDKQRLNRLEKAVSNESITNLKQLYNEHITARTAASLVSSDLFSKEPLPNVGGDVWRTLWEAARTYSDKQVYPEQRFPVTDDNARCVLCHQSLSQEAVDRLNSFESFVLDKSKKREDEAKKAYEAALLKLQESHITIKDIRKITSFIRDTLSDENLANSIKICSIINAWRLREIKKKIGVADFVILTPQVNVPEAKIAELRRNLEEKLAVFLAEKDSPERIALIEELNELKDRKWLGTVKSDVIEEIKRLKSIAELQKLRKTTATNRITNLSTELAKRLVTDRLRARFAKEIARLGVAEQHAIELQHAKSSGGAPLFHVRMTSNPDAPVGKVLSEGEHRCVALAAFLAELSTVKTPSGIVFDDPVSSLDHIHRDKVAERLAIESQHRQVIVFTHDIAFLVLLEEACQKTRNRAVTPITYRAVSRGNDAAGFCHTEPPGNALPVDKLILQMRRHLENVKIHDKRGDQANWRREVRSFSDQLREAWERAVENAVSPVIKRLSKKVHTDGLIRLTVLQEQDCHDMRDAYYRCSNLLHSQPGAINKPLPTPKNIENEILIIESWTSNLKRRQDKIT